RAARAAPPPRHQPDENRKPPDSWPPLGVSILSRSGSRIPHPARRRYHRSQPRRELSSHSRLLPRRQIELLSIDKRGQRFRWPLSIPRCLFISLLHSSAVAAFRIPH